MSAETGLFLIWVLSTLWIIIRWTRFVIAPNGMTSRRPVTAARYRRRWSDETTTRGNAN